MGFDWIRFLESTNIDHVVGPTENVRAGHVGINCPQCGDDDKYHFSIRLEDGKVRGCWRDPGHWLSPSMLVSTLAAVPVGEARRMVAVNDFPDDTSPAALLRKLEAEPTRARARALTTVKLPASARAFTMKPTFTERPFVDYLKRRGFEDHLLAADLFGLVWCALGEWGPRILCPLFHGGEMVGWTARAIGKATIKYRTHPPGDDVVNRLLFNADLGCLDDEPVQGGKLLVVCEGPFDAMNLEYHDERVRAVGLLGLNVGPAKLSTLADLSGRFDRTVLLLDADGPGAVRALSMQADLRAALGDVPVGHLPPGIKDPGDLTGEQVRTLTDTLLP